MNAKCMDSADRHDCYEGNEGHHDLVDRLCNGGSETNAMLTWCRIRYLPVESAH